MRAVHIQKYGRLPSLTKCQIPSRSPGQFLIKMKYAPINPSDLFFYLGLYGIRKQGFPIMGFEGSGIIEEADSAEFKGRKVSIFANMSNGTYADYIVSKPSEVILWPNGTQMTDQQLSMCCVNPLSVLGMVDIIEQEKAENVVLSAASSNTSKMIMRCLAKYHKGIRVFGISRSEKYDQELRGIGFQKVFRMEEGPKVKQELSGSGKTLFMDCVGGNFAGQIFNVLPPKSIMVNYGRLSKQNLGSVDLGQLYYRNKHIRGFWLNNYLGQLNKDRLESLKTKVIKNSQLFKQKIRKVYPMQDFEKASRQSIKDQSQGKILLQLYE